MQFGVADNEVLRYFDLSRSDVDLKDKWEIRVTPKIFSRIFKSGVFTIRLNYTTPEELRTVTEISHEEMSSNSECYGGVLGVVDFIAKDVHNLPNKNGKVCCVLDKPNEENLAHADVVCSFVKSCPDTRTKLKVGGAMSLNFIYKE